MTVRLEATIPENVVEIGEEVAQGMVDALNAADNPTGSNPLLTKSAGDAAYLEKDGGGTVVGTVVVDTDGTVGGNTATITGTSVEVNNFGVGTISIDPVLGITFPDSTSQGTAAPAAIDIQVFGSPTESGTFTWTKPAGAKFVRAYLIGGGGSGASGARKATSSNRAGGNGGLGGTIAVFDIPASLLGSTETVYVAEGQDGALGRTLDNFAGDIGSPGLPSNFGKYRTGTTAGATPGNDVLLTAQTNVFYTYGLFQATGSANGRGNITTGIAASSYAIPICTFGGGGGGGAGAGLTSSAAGSAGGAKIASAGSNAGTSDAIAGGTAGSGNPLTDGGNGADSTIIGLGGSGGGGGGHNFSGAASNGGNGGWPGGGGGGGGASDNGFTSGAGGKGANGAVFVITFF